MRAQSLCRTAKALEAGGILGVDTLPVLRDVGDVLGAAGEEGEKEDQGFHGLTPRSFY